MENISMSKAGKLTTWKDGRGFGFIEPEDGSKAVFLHVSEVQHLNRRPQIGDVVFYEPRVESNGKVRATKVSIQGVGVGSRSTISRNRIVGGGFQLRRLRTAIRLTVPIAIVAVGSQFMPGRYPSLITAATKPNCQVKGNISVSSRNKIYHLPGMEDYESTVIDESAGERWFCSESEASEAGWKKAPR
jgi:cold shock CspA family protein